VNATSLRTACFAGLLLAALCVPSFAAAQSVPQPAHGTSTAVPGTISSSSGPIVQCPCNAGLPQAADASAPSPVECPCNADLPGGPSGAMSVGELHASDAGGAHSAPATTRRVGVVRPAANQRGGTFDWAAAGVGAGVTAWIALLVAGGVLLLGRRRVRAQLPAA
jgi:hypothetical protein